MIDITYNLDKSLQEENLRRSMEEADFSEELISIFIECILSENDE